jgi:hypothetical protein
MGDKLAQCKQALDFVKLPALIFGQLVVTRRDHLKNTGIDGRTVEEN